jgi:uncharacterized protein
MYIAVIHQFVRTLRALDAILVKAAQHAEARKFDPNNFCTARIAPDMLPFTRQIQIACDAAKRIAAALSGKDAPVYTDSETTLEQLRERIAKTVAYLETFTADDFAKVTPETLVPLPNNPARALLAPDALLARAVPNFYFHVTTAYALLRAGGVDVGKRDFLGDLPLVDV